MEKQVDEGARGPPAGPRTHRATAGGTGTPLVETPATGTEETLTAADREQWQNELDAKMQGIRQIMSEFEEDRARWRKAEDGARLREGWLEAKESRKHLKKLRYETYRERNKMDRWIHEMSVQLQTLQETGQAQERTAKDLELREELLRREEEALEAKREEGGRAREETRRRERRLDVEERRLDKEEVKVEDMQKVVELLREEVVLMNREADAVRAQAEREQRWLARESQGLEEKVRMVDTELGRLNRLHEAMDVEQIAHDAKNRELEKRRAAVKLSEKRVELKEKDDEEVLKTLKEKLVLAKEELARERKRLEKQIAKENALMMRKSLGKEKGEDPTMLKMFKNVFCFGKPPRSDEG